MKHNFLRRLGALVLALALALPAAAVPAWADPGDNFTVSIEAADKKVNLNDLKGSAQLDAKTLGEVSGGTVTYRWSCEPAGVVTVSPASSASVTLAPVTEGTATVKVAATCTWKESGSSATRTKVVEDAVEVNVTSVPVSSLSFSNSISELKTHETHQLVPVFTPANATNQTLDWSSSQSDIASVDQNGWVTALKPGSTTITARSRDNPNARAMCTLTIVDSETPVIELTPAQADIPSYTVGERIRFDLSVTPSNATVAWTVNPASAVTRVQDGEYIFLRPGRVTITVNATGRNGRKVTETRTVTVVDPNSLNATSLTAKGPTDITLSAGAQTQLGVNVSPSTAYVAWESDNRAAVTVDPSTGMATAVAPGTANVTATAQKKDGTPLTVTFKVSVTGRATGIEFAASPNITEKDGVPTTRFDYGKETTRTLYASVKSSGSVKTNTYIVFTSSDTSVVTATARGSTGVDLAVPSGRPAGRAIITATVYDSTTKQPVLGDDDKPLAAELAAVVSGLTLSETSLTMYVGQAKTVSIAGTFGEIENSGYSDIRWRSTDDSIVSVENGSVSANNLGTATITATKGNYSATCAVTVTEDPDVVVNAGSTTAGNPIVLGSSAVASRLNQVASKYTGSGMESITSIYVTPAQGVVYNNHRSEADTGSGVAMSEKYTVGGSGPQSISALSFVPNRSFTGEARISYIGMSKGQSISGVITVNVNEMSDVTYTANGTPVTFLTDDFNTICKGKTGSPLKYVTFTPPSASAGTLYYNYTNETHPGEKVISTTQYNRTSSPSLDKVTFVPAQGYSGTVRITYRAMNTSNQSYTGTVIINVTRASTSGNPGDIYYWAKQDGWATFRSGDFANAGLRCLGEALSHVRFALPDSSEGTLFYNYRGFSDYDSVVGSTTSYYRSGTPSLDAVSFVPTTTTSGQVAISYTGYGVSGTAFTGTVYVGEGTSSSGSSSNNTQQGIVYNVSSGRSVGLQANDFNNACVAATGASLDYVTFTLPASSQGVLRYSRSGSYNNLAATTQCYRANSSSYATLISSVSFLASQTFTGTVRVPFTGYNTNGVQFSSSFTIQVQPNTFTLTGNNGNALRLSSSQVSGAVNGLMKQNLSYIEFTSLPGASTGRLYLNYSGYGTGTQVSTGVRYYASSTPSIDQISFVPKGRFQGDATAVYTAVSTSGEQVRGQITFHITASSGSSYFTDMGSYAWAAGSVDYLYQNKVTNGMTTTTFGPSQPILRRDFVLMLYRAFKFSGGSASNTGFADVPAGAYYAQAVSAAKQMGIANGDGVNFMPASQITRQDAMVMIKNAMSAAGKLQGTSYSTAILNSFPDGASVSGYAREAVSTLVQIGAVNGSNGMLNPRSPITRAEAAVILHFVMTA